MRTAKRELQQRFILSKREKMALVSVAEAHEVSISALIRNLVRDEAERLNVWPEVKNENEQLA